MKSLIRNNSNIKPYFFLIFIQTIELLVQLTWTLSYLGPDNDITYPFHSIKSLKTALARRSFRLYPLLSKFLSYIYIIQVMVTACFGLRPHNWYYVLRASPNSRADKPKTSSFPAHVRKNIPWVTSPVLPSDFPLKKCMEYSINLQRISLKRLIQGSFRYIIDETQISLMKP